MQVEFVEGLDVIVLRGSERDVQRVMEIIKQIEELSAVTVPAIEIYPLKYVDSIRMGALCSSSTLRGFWALASAGEHYAARHAERFDADRPAENVKMAIELIQRLDQPIVPTARFEVFPLKHANAAEAKTLIDGFLGQAIGTSTRTSAPAGPGGTVGWPVAPRWRADSDARTSRLIVSDPRTNSLIVSASPRDIAEIAALIARIDTPGAAAELKVFTVANGDAQAWRYARRAVFGPGARRRRWWRWRKCERGRWRTGPKRAGSDAVLGRPAN